mmetsp:Transcript_28832/g.67402  ORF Transcript_28832/g.67402 Transcript_28832/m.67402 type:complete len:200 (+) Transcript_28832:231-830(+)
MAARVCGSSGVISSARRSCPLSRTCTCTCATSLGSLPWPSRRRKARRRKALNIPPRGAVRMLDAPSPPRAATSTGSAESPRQGGRTGAFLRAARCALHATRITEFAARWSGASVPSRSARERGDARMMDATSPPRAATSIASTKARRRGGGTGARLRGACYATHATGISSGAALWSGVIAGSRLLHLHPLAPALRKTTR